MKQGGNRPYHHGDLRRTLLDAALQLVAERGIPDFTLREVARQAGVSHNAPYNHFADKAELVVALTVEGFQTLERAVRSAYEQTAGTPLERTLAISGAYLRFALENPTAFRLMFRPELRQTSHDARECDEAVKSAADATFQILLDGIAASQQAGELLPEPSGEMLALALGSATHGLTVMLLDNLWVKEKAVSSLEGAEQLMSHVMHMVTQGLVVPS
ncbi:MAG TPA: TetR/AcrR family transcriptional regulator [Ktedonobacteraceae bacterium]|jgi:AcrR family transcriptional regulator|nr:TetR/AcrR family transcriptional regulator [Ktedonobacteraceae bacterium]